MPNFAARACFSAYDARTEQMDCRAPATTMESLKSVHYRLLKGLTHIPGVRGLWLRFPAGSLGTRTWFGISRFPHYAWGAFAAAELGKRLGLPGISVIEFGVGDGQGLLALEAIAAEVSRHFQLPIAVFGFGAREGRPAPVDYRDVPYLWSAGEDKTDAQKLQPRLTSAELILGDVAETLPPFLERGDMYPVGFTAFDLNYYSSTLKAFHLFAASPNVRLPRVYAHFDNIFLPETASFNDYIGELCAIREFNEAHHDKKLCPIHLLRHMQPQAAPWHDQMYVMHDFHHPLYCRNISG